jgi:hypothetical protein
MFCNNCGAKINDGQKFCTSCGAEIKPRLVGAMKPLGAMPANAKPVPWTLGRGTKILIWVVVGIVVLGILSAIVLASLNTARQKGMGATSTTQADGWQSYNSVADAFGVLFPEYPTYDSNSDTSGSVAYDYHTYKAVGGTTSFEVIKYIYRDQIDTSNPDDLLQRFLNGFVNAIPNGKLISSDYTYSGTYRALEFQVSSTGDENVKGMLILVGQTPFLVVEDYFTTNYNEVEYQKFITSFTAK